ncbi:MAG: PRC-barrel domain-containing protein [Acetobacteraceae bacterium]
MIAATALIAWPVLAQTTTGTTTTTTTTPPSSPGLVSPTPPVGTTAPRSTSPTMGSSALTTSPKYFTADRQVRVSKVVGASVYNDQNQSVGSIDDLLMSDADHKAATVVISVGGFLGMGSKLVSVPFDQLKIENDRIVMPGATKASLEGMPEYRYTNA